jgi:predicted ATPase/tetratricopeptide (TPR) repeat protein
MTGNVRAPIAKFFGRAGELATLRDSLRGGARLLTICGPGGAGKTRLATELLRGVEGDYDGGVWFCDLAGASSLDDVCRVVADVLGVELGGDALSQLADVVASRGALLLCLDNLEQVIEPGAMAATRWLGASDDVRVLVTSRERLRVAGEVVLDVPPLEGHGEELFVDRATLIGTPVSEADADAVARIVVALDHQPLAIELAAARSAVMTIAELADMLPERWRLLEHNRRDAPERHHSVLATLAWSWELLDQREQEVFAQCSLFAARFDRHDAEALVGTDVLPQLSSLREKSLLRASRDGDRLTMSMFRIMRDFGRARLEDCGLEASTYAHHAEWVLGRCRGAAGVDELGELLDEIITVHHWAVSSGGESALSAAVDALLAVGPYFEARGPVDAQLARWDELLSALSTPSARGHVERAFLRRMAGRMDEAADDLAVAEQLGGAPDVQFATALEISRRNFAAGDLKAARQSGERAHAMARELGEREMGLAAAQLGRLAHGRGDPEGARRLHTESLEKLRAVGDIREVGRVLSALGFTVQDLGDADQAEACFREAIAIYRKLGHRRAEARALGYLGNVFRSRLEREAAAREYIEAVAICNAQGDPWLESVYLMDHGILLSALGDAGATAMFERAVVVAERACNHRCVALINSHLGALAADEGRIGDAERHFETAASRLVDDHDGQMPAVLALQRNHVLLASLRAGERGDDIVRDVRALLDNEPSVQSEHMRLARLILLRAADRAAPPDDALVVADDGSWFRFGERVSLEAHPSVGRVLLCLATTSDACAVDAIFKAGWPGERAVAAARKNRVRVAISTLRKHGVPVAFDRGAGGYRLQAAVVIDS